MQYYNNLLRSL